MNGGGAPVRALSLALFGHPVGHSRSAGLLDGLALPCGRSVRYVVRDVPPSRLEAAVGLVRSGELDGANVTVPHKRAATVFVDRLEGAARELGAVNVLARVAGDAVAGANTDGEGFLESLALLPAADVRRAVVLGSGGAARAVEHALASRGAAVTLVSRRPRAVVPVVGATHVVGWDDPRLGEIVSGSELVVQATPLGMPPAAETEPPLPPGAIRDGHLVVDLVYEPWQTRFLAQARARRAHAVNGWPMLVGQAAAALELWARGGAGRAVRERAAGIETRDPRRA